MSIEDATLSAWIDGELESREAGRIAAAVQADPALAARADKLRLADRLVRDAFPASAALPAALLARLGLDDPVAAGAPAGPIPSARAPSPRRTSAMRRVRQRSGIVHRRAALGLAIAVAGALAGVMAAQGEREGPVPAYRALSGPEALNGNVILVLEAGADRTRVAAVLAQHRGRIAGEGGVPGGIAAIVPEGRMEGALAALRTTPGVALAEPLANPQP